MQVPQEGLVLLNGKCLQSAVIYQANVPLSDINQSETYVGFKTRYRNHTNSSVMQSLKPQLS